MQSPHTIRHSLKIGDYVTITNKGQVYSTYRGWFTQNHIAHEIADKYELRKVPNDGDIGTIAAIAPHETESTDICAVEINNKIYIMNPKGLELCDTDTTTKEKFKLYEISFEDLLKGAK